MTETPKMVEVVQVVGVDVTGRPLVVFLDGQHFVRHDQALDAIEKVRAAPQCDAEPVAWRAQVIDIISERVRSYRDVTENAEEIADAILAATPPSRSDAVNATVSSNFTPGDPVEVRLQNDAIDEIVIRRGDVHIEQMSDDSWFMGVDASDGSYWQFWFGAKNRKSHVEFRHTETVPAAENARPDQGTVAVSSDSDELAEWKQAASVEAGLRREFLGIANDLAECIGRYMSETDYRSRLLPGAAEFVANRGLTLSSANHSPPEDTTVEFVELANTISSTNGKTL